LVFQNIKGKKFEKQNGAWLKDINSISNGASYADLDQDGDPDIVVNNINQKAFVLQNKLIDNDTSKNFIAIQLIGEKQNVDALGARVVLHSGNKKQSRFQQSVHGFLSSSNSPLVFGLGKSSGIDSLEIYWPNGQKSVFYDLQPGKINKINYQESVFIKAVNDIKPSIFEEIQFIDHKHEESYYVDFKNHPLLLQGYSQQGPKIAVADLNKDGTDDFFIGGAYQFDGKLYMSKPEGDFEITEIPTSSHEDLSSVFFDLENDGDLDLYITSGGVEVNRPSFYQDRIYINRGGGVFEKANNVLPEIQSSTSVVVKCDYDKDGDQDLFVGARVDINNYPTTPQSYLLNNQGGVFKDSAGKINGLSHAGMITSAEWGDLDGDGWKDLVLAGEFMPIKIFRNIAGELTEVKSTTGLSDFSGWWNCIKLVDVDNDNDLDILAGNLGGNHDFNISYSTPMTVHFADFDNNGSIDPIFACYDQGESYPIASLDVLSAQIPVVKNQFLHYSDYAKENTESFLSTFKKPYQTLKITEDHSTLFINEGNLEFTSTKLPLEVQSAPIMDFETTDINNDGFIDIIAAGNQYNTEVIRGRYDALTGIVLVNDQKGGFQVIDSKSSGVHLPQEVSFIEIIQHPVHGGVLLAGIKQGKIKGFKVNELNNSNIFLTTSSLSINP
jgi:hypothetical protein